MNKRVLMLSAATAALFLGPALADDLDVTTALTDPVSTSNANNGPGDITIESSGSITIAQAAPVVTIDSSNSVSNSGLLSNKNTTGAIGVEINTGTSSALTGDLINNGTIDLSGSGTGKIGINMIGTGSFSSPDLTTTDVIALGSTSVINVVGDDSIGIDLQNGSTLNGNVEIGGKLSVAATSATATTGGDATAIEIANVVNGNISISEGATVAATGQGAQGLIMSGTINGALENFGTLESLGTVAPSASVTNPEAGNALSIGGSIANGFINAGPLSTTDTTAVAAITEGGIGNAVLVTPTLGGVTPTAPLDIGVYTLDTNDPGYSFYNRGSINALPIDPNLSVTAMAFGGTSAFHTTLHGLGLFNAGAITATAVSSSSSTTDVNATAISIGDYAFFGDGGAGAGLFNSNERGVGTISASVSGTNGGAATTIFISANGSLPEITNQGTISASATTTNIDTINLSAIAIDDLSGTLSKITNSGTITATATTLGHNTQIAEAANLSANSTGVDFENTGTVIGDIIFGTGGDTLNVSGTSSSAAGTVIGNVIFGDTLVPGTVDQLIVGNFGTVTGDIVEAPAGTLDVSVDTRGTLNINNTDQNLFVRNFDIGNPIPSAVNGTLTLTVASTLPNNLLVHASNEATIEDGAVVNIKFGSFLPEEGNFILIETPDGNLHIDQSEFDNIANNFTLPFLFNGGLCTFDVNGINVNDQCNGNSPGASELVLHVIPKTADQIGLTGNAATVFPFATAALVTDPLLGAAVVNGVTDTATAQAAFQSFVPDASGGTRAVAISLTDSATGPVAARQRELRLYANQPGDTTLWGNEFAQFINEKGNNGLPGFKDRGFGAIVGLDTGDSTDGWYGGAFTFFSGDVDQQAPADTRSNDEWYMLSGYTDWRSKELFLDTQLTVGYGDLTGHRFVDVGGVSREADSKHASLMGALGATVGTEFVYGATTLTPQISLDGLTMRQNGYNEANGGSGFDLSVQPFYASSLRGFVGGSARQDFNFGDFYLQPEVRVGYRYDALADAVKLKAAFTSIPDSEFTVIGPDPERGNIVAGASVAGTTGAWSLGLHYDFVRGNNGSTTQVGTLSLLGRI